MWPVHAHTDPDIDAVTALIESVARDVIVPRFGRLRTDQIESKATPGYLDDMVTIVDREAEARLTQGLRTIVDVQVIGEEATYEHEELLDHLQSDEPLWIVDPIDGTHNFAAGLDGFGTMVGFAVGGRVRAGWIYLPLRGEHFVAESGAGAFLNGRRVYVPGGEPHAVPSGSLFLRFMPDTLSASVITRSTRRFQDAPPAGAAAVEYTDILRGRKDFAMYYRLLPWDHGGPALILTEAGGCVEHLDGTAYSVRSPNRIAIATHAPRLAERIRDWFTPDTTS